MTDITNICGGKRIRESDLEALVGESQGYTGGKAIREAGQTGRPWTIRTTRHSQQSPRLCGNNSRRGWSAKLPTGIGLPVQV